MQLRTIISGTLSLLLLSGAGALSQESHIPSAHAIPMPQTGLPGVFGSGGGSEGFRVAQAGDPRITELEERIRQMSGTIEELNFQVLQMQEQLRKMQEDNEYRFQQLEQRKSGARTGETNQSVATAAPPAGTVEDNQAIPSEKGRPAEAATSTATTQSGRGEPPKSMGTIIFDALGNVRGGSIGDQVSAGGAQAPGHESAPAASGEEVAALPATDDPDELYRNAYEFILSGDYKTAEAGFRDHIARFPADPKTPDARFWLGESLLSQHKYRDAAEVFLAASKEYPSSKKGPEMLLKLGVSLAGLKQRDVACATFGEIGKRYPSSSQQLKERVKKEQAAAGC